MDKNGADPELRKLAAERREKLAGSHRRSVGPGRRRN
jgi:hypothetical protein